VREVAPGVFVFTSALYATTTTVIAGADGGCLVVDPAIGPADLTELARWLAARHFRVRAGWSTHPHWDHVLWSAELRADVPRYATPAAAAAASARRDVLLAEAEAEAPGHDPALFGRLTVWPGDEVPWDGPAALIIAHDAHAPGHGALFLPSAGVLVAGDMCSDVEIPLVDGEADDPFGMYRTGLGRLAALSGVRVVVPGHGHPGDGAAFRARVATDMDYLDAVEAGVAVTDPRLGPEWLRQEHARQAALAQRGR
jgi:glyoxylase-like metal-dependent hydrolase (beta-lactamase superfamily II)